MSFRVDINHAQSRLVADRLTVAATGSELGGSVSSGTWIDPVTETLMLRPVMLEDQWYVSSVGAYSKLGLADFSAGVGWEERSDQHWAGPWLALKDSAMGGSAMTVAGFAKNRGMSIAWFSYGSGDSFLQLKCGWSDTGDDSAGVSLRFWTDGLCEVLKAGVVVGSGKVTGSRVRDVRRGQVFEAMLIPCRHRELLVVTKNGDGFSHVFTDILADDPDPEIVGAGKFWFETVHGGTQVQVAPMRFTSSGYATSRRTSLMEAPLAGESLLEFANDPWLVSPAPYKVYGHPGFGGGTQGAVGSLVEWDGLTGFVADGARLQCRARVDLSTTDPGFTPVVYGIQVGYGAVLGLTDGLEETDVTGACLSASLRVGDSADDVRVDVLLREPGGLQMVDPGLFGGGNVPLRVSVDGGIVFDGATLPADAEWGASDLASRAGIGCGDAWSALERSVFGERYPLDGLSLGEALLTFVSKAGYQAGDMVVSAGGPDLPFAPGRATGEWNLVVETGDTAAEWIARLMETFVPDWWYGFRPKSDGSGTEFFAIKPADLPVVPAVTVYRSVAEAVSVGGLTVDEARDRVVRSWQTVSVGPVATEVRVRGRDPQGGRPLEAVKTDWLAQDVGLAVGGRPSNWVGEPRRFTLVDAGLVTEAAVTSTCGALFNELSRVRRLVTFESSLLTGVGGGPVWRGDLVAVHGAGLFRVVAFEWSFGFEADGMVWRECRTVVEEI